VASDASHRISRVPCYLRSPAQDNVSFAYGIITLYDGPFQEPSARQLFGNLGEALLSFMPGLTTPIATTAATYHAAMVWAVPCSLAATKGIVSFPRGTWMFRFPRLPSGWLLIHQRDNRLRRLGFPIRRFSDQSLFASSPRLFAGYYVLHRLLVPRHSPYALIIFSP
jgi:hypothetical protein